MEERKKMLAALVKEPSYVPMKLKELAILLDLPKSRRDELKEVLDEMVAEGSLGISKKGKYGVPELFSLTGVFSGTARGFGFVTVEGMDQDVFIPGEQTMGAMHGDQVQLVLEGEAAPGKRASGRILKILHHANTEIVGYYQKNKSFGFVIPDNQRLSTDVFIPQGEDLGAVTGHKVVVSITDFGSSRRKPEGKITEILGHVNDPGTDILSLVRAYGMPEAFPEEVMEEIETIPDEVGSEGIPFPALPEGDQPLELGDLPLCAAQEQPFAGRLDLRALPTVTIDGEDAKDLDDAITLGVNRAGNYILGVHIADVSHYVREGSFLDQEALRRGTSVYLTDRVIPMLPHKLSNGICSLNAGTDRLALSCIMEVNPQGTVTDHRICETLIRVDRRMTYHRVNAILEGEEGAEAGYEDFVSLFLKMKELSGILREKRRKRGAIRFDFPESKIVLDSNGKPLDILPYERNDATRLIEDFMLLANETVAEDYFWQGIPFLYRTHDNPDPEKMKQLGIFVNNFGYTVRMQQGELRPGELQRLLDQMEGKQEEPLLSRLVLRSMKQAKYTTQSTGHFGLAARYYTHFTSPIRRYPDLQIHRIIKENIRGGLGERRQSHYERILPQVAENTSALERRAEEAERETDKLKKCEYMAKHIGESFEGVISGVTAWGFYVELPNTVEGLVHISQMRDDYYIFNEKLYQLKGEMTGKTYKLGQTVRVIVASTDRLLRTVDFELE